MIACTPYEVASQILAHVQAQLTQTRGGEADRVFVAPHADPVIEFCARGVAYVGIRSAAAVQPKGKCAPVWRLDLSVGVFRCFPVMKDNGPPTEAAVDSAARDVCDDMEAMRRGVTAALAGQQFILGTWSTVPPQGGAHGSKLQVQVDFSPALFTEPTSPKLPGDPRPDPADDEDDEVVDP